MREQSRNVSVETVQRADEMATAALSLLDVNATGEASVNDLLAQVIGKAGEYRTSPQCRPLHPHATHPGGGSVGASQDLRVAPDNIRSSSNLPCDSSTDTS